MPRYQVKPREDGRGPYRWSHVAKNPMGGALRQGSIYRRIGDDLIATKIKLFKLFRNAASSVP